MSLDGRQEPRSNMVIHPPGKSLVITGKDLYFLWTPPGGKALFHFLLHFLVPDRSTMGFH